MTLSLFRRRVSAARRFYAVEIAPLPPVAARPLLRRVLTPVWVTDRKSLRLWLAIVAVIAAVTIGPSIAGAIIW
jgi:hypothetical protein